MKKNEIITIIISAILFSVAIVQHAVNGQSEFMIQATPWFLCIIGILTILALDIKERKTWLWLVTVFVLTWGVEALGVATGWPFGDYEYSAILGLSVFNTPLIIGLNWIVVATGAYALIKLSRFKKNWLIILMPAVLTLLMDIILEPAAIKLSYWQWTNDIIPIQNYISWFTIALLISASINKFKIKFKPLVPASIFVLLLVYFLSINIIY